MDSLETIFSAHNRQFLGLCMADLTRQVHLAGKCIRRCVSYPLIIIDHAGQIQTKVDFSNREACEKYCIAWHQITSKTAFRQNKNTDSLEQYLNQKVREHSFFFESFKRKRFRHIAKNLHGPPCLFFTYAIFRVG